MDLTKAFIANTTGIQHLGVPTDDFPKTIDFYKSLGFTPVFEKENEVCFLQLGTLVVETYPAKEGAAMCNGGIDHVALNVNDIEEAWKLANEGGYELLDTGINFLPFFANGVKYFTILGPNHEKIEFNQYL